MSAPVWMQETSWRETGRQVRFGPFDGRLMIFVVLWMLFPSYIFFYLTVAAMAFFYVLEFKGYTLANAYRKIGVFLAGKKRNGVHYWRQNKFRI